MAMSHANCSHPKTPAARAACRKGRTQQPTVPAIDLLNRTLEGELLNVQRRAATAALRDSAQIDPAAITRVRELAYETREQAARQGLKHMDRTDVRDLFDAMTSVLELHGWRLKFDNARRRAGQCNYSMRTISISAPLLEVRTFADTLETITHELAHAVTPGHNHDYTWKKMHRDMGGNGSTRYNMDEDTRARALATARYIGTCAHGKQFPRQSAPKRGSSHVCKCPEGRTTVTWARNF
ncbi:SprT-like protease [Gordonia phage BigChungus]|uniref:SprT-like protease n=1 Tax=Gordonia phage BigChungus TaxID=2762389 RepID=A0A7G8LQL2_9CAUD|nr:SprT-like protease [Gordonia phage BigChungus]QNJ59394.1 SprT-like protease [Gordonia phage Feastonyeet]QNJ59534.1 SprT-like protease [Gordonia phage BigChungus]